MKIIEAINAVDSHMPNSYSQNDKVSWLSTLDAMVEREIIGTHEGGENCSFEGYNSDTDINETELLMCAPYDQIYLRWLEAQIAYQNGETDRYNNAITLYNTVYTACRNDYHRTHKPKQKGNSFF